MAFITRTSLVAFAWSISLCLDCSLAAESAAPAGTPAWRFSAAQMRLRLGESAMIPVSLSAAATSDASLELKSTGDACVEILRQPSVIAGHSLGFCRIRAVRPGSATLQLGEGKLAIHVANESPVALTERMRPVISSPVQHAALCGKVAVGAEVWVGAVGCDRKNAPAAKLVLPDGTKLAAVEAFPPLDGPFWRYVFEVDCDKVKPGEQAWTVECPLPMAHAPAKSMLASDPLELAVFASDPKQVVAAGECEAQTVGNRGEKLGQEPPGVSFDAAASGSRFVSLFGQRPAFVVALDVPEAGNYQWFVRARGTLAGSAYPSLELMTGEDGKRVGAGRLVSTTWRRCALGNPFKLEQGRALASLALGNDFRYRERIDRNADLDTFELVKVPVAGGGASMMMMAGASDPAAMNMMAAGGGEGEKKGAAAAGLRCAFTSIVEGDTINGECDLTAFLSARNFKNDKDYDNIRSTLVINGKPTATARGRSPRFHVYPHDFRKGGNTVQVVATDPHGAVASSLEQALLGSAVSFPADFLPVGPDGKFLDRTPPEITVLYPKAGASISRTGDVLVLRAFDDTAVTRYQPLLDGKPLGLPLMATRDTGLVVLPLDTSSVAPGRHQLAVKAIDKSGKETNSLSLEVVVAEPSRNDQWALPYPRAVCLARTFGFGIDARDLAAILLKGESNWLAAQFQTPDASRREALVQAYAQALFPQSDAYQVRGGVIAHALMTGQPARDRFVLWTENHFNTWISKTGAPAKLQEHKAFAAAGPARFSDLLLISATSPAMIQYLDQQNSLGKQLNENYAREIMELHTVGVKAGYTQQDVTSLAHLLTGWGAQREADELGNEVSYQFRFSPYLNEAGEETVFGLKLPAAGSPDTADDRILEVIEMLAARPQTAEFISRKLVEHYLGVPANPEVVGRLAATYLNTGGDMLELLKVLAREPDVMRVSRNGKLLQPVEYGMAAQRSCAAAHPWAVINLGDRSGRNLFDRSTPDGYPEANEDYADSNSQLQKWAFSKEIEGNLTRDLAWEWFDKDRLADANHRAALIRAVALQRCGAPLSAASTEALQRVLQQRVDDQNQRRILFGSFFLMLPEMQCR